MYRQLIVNFDMSNLMLIGEIIFVSIFAASLVWVFRKGSKNYYNQLAQMPFDEPEEGK